MAIQSQPSRIPEPFAGSGTKNTIPATNSTPSASQAASWASGFPPECSQPISAGGCPVPRNDVNGALNQLSQDFAFRQDGGIWEWSALADYDTERVVRGSDGLLYYAIAQSGPSIAAGAQDPALDTSHTYWVSPRVPTMPADDSSGAAASTAWVGLHIDAISAPADLYVNASSGDDTNDGLSPSTAKKTVTAAMSSLQAVKIINSPHVTVHIAPGTYNESIGSTLEYITVDLDFASGAVVDGGIWCGGRSDLRITGTFSTKGNIICTGVSSLYIVDATISFANVSTDALLSAGYMSYISVGSSSFSFTNCTVSVGTVASRDSSTIRIYTGNSWTGSVTGRRYSSYRNSCITGAGSQTLFPGTTAGITEASSWYD